jgi:hypothetical protein
MKPEDFSKNLNKIMEELLKEATKGDSLKDLGDEAAFLIQKRTRLGYGAAEQGGSKQKLEPLSGPYKKQRKSKISGPTTPAKSNLTLSGQMLDNIESFISEDGKVTVGFKEGSVAFDKAKWNSKLRPFNFLTKAEIAQLRKKLEASLGEKLRLIQARIK